MVFVQTVKARKLKKPINLLIDYLERKLIIWEIGGESLNEIYYHCFNSVFYC